MSAGVERNVALDPPIRRVALLPPFGGES